jgi:hypothetical protein
MKVRKVLHLHSSGKRAIVVELALAGHLVKNLEFPQTVQSLILVTGRTPRGCFMHNTFLHVPHNV